MKRRPLTTLVFAFALHLSAAAQAPDGGYTLKAPEPRTGSMIRDTIAWSAHVPLDKTYEQMTPEQQAAVRSAYQDLPADQEPPYPAEGMAPIVRAVAKLVSRQRFEGEVLMHVRVDASGKAQEFKLIKYPSMEAARAVATVVLLTPFKPARCGAQPCAMEFPLHLKLRLE